MKLWGHGYWKVIAVRTEQKALLRTGETTFTIILQRCSHCGKIRDVDFRGDWGDHVDGIFED